MGQEQNDELAPKVLGIDPGQTGALAWVTPTGRLHEVEDMPVVNGEVNAHFLAQLILASGRLEACVVEKVHSMPKQGVASSFKFGTSYGIVIGVVAALEIPLFFAPPQEWKGVMHLIGKDKEAARKLAIERWPTHSDLFRLKKHSDRAEAALIALSWLYTSTRAERQIKLTGPSSRPNSKRRLIRIYPEGAPATVS
jgi:crossover junction endodeoxyribonuclease RuvC